VNSQPGAYFETIPMQEDPIVYSVFLVFTGAALVATLALYARQALLVAYILLGALLGPSALGLVDDPELVGEMSHIGIMFLLFLMGLELNPRELLLLMRRTTIVTVGSSLVFAGIGVGTAAAFGYTLAEALVVGAAMVFSSTIIGLKLLPTTILHHQRTGELVISILLMQDLLAILLLLALKGGGGMENPFLEAFKLSLALPLLIAAAWVVVKYLLVPLLHKFDTIKEYVFLLAIGWCLGLAEAAHAMGLSAEIGAFVAGISLAANPVSLFIAESLKPLRDFFLVLFFFSLGAGFELDMLGVVLLPSLLLAGAMLLVKGPVFGFLLRRVGEDARRAREVGNRLAQLSEFSLLLAVLAQTSGVIGESASYLIQLTTLLTFLVSTYLVVMRYPTPIALDPKLRRD
jgi:Kef-type K+ transport system membrane component KefB